MCQIDTGGTRVLRKRNCRKPASSLVTQALTLACIRDRRCRCTNTSAAGYTVSRICSYRCVRVICREGAGYRAFQNLSMISSGDFVDRNVFILVSFDYFFFFLLLHFVHLLPVCNLKMIWWKINLPNFKLFNFTIIYQLLLASF